MPTKHLIYAGNFYRFFKRYYVNYYFFSTNRNFYFIMPLLINCQFISHGYNIKKCNREIRRLIEAYNKYTLDSNIHINATYWLKKKIKYLVYRNNIIFKFYFLSYVDKLKFQYKILEKFNILKACFIEYEKLISN